MAKRRQQGVRARHAGRAKGPGGELHVSSFLTMLPAASGVDRKGLATAPLTVLGAQPPVYTVSGYNPLERFWGCEAPRFSYAPVLRSGSLVTLHHW